MQEIVTLACEKWAAGDKVTSWQIKITIIIIIIIIIQTVIPVIFSPRARGTTRSVQTRLQQI